MDPRRLASLVDAYLGALVTAGDFALAIQDRVRHPGTKPGENAWVSAVTDADRAIQTYLEVFTLALDPALGFYGEESADSANRAYFDPDAPTRVSVDPVNGTFLYAAGRDGWDIIVGLSDRGRLEAAISYMPARGTFYLAVRGVGARTGQRQAPRLDAMRPLDLRPGSRICLTYRAPGVVERLAGHYRAFDIVADDDPAGGLDNLNALFTGGIDAFACRGGNLLDWGAIAFIAEAAGGRASNLRGEPLAGLDPYRPDCQSDMLVAASPAAHAEILALLEARD